MAARRVTIADVARLAGVSTGAVSFALNDRPGVGAQTRARILAAAAELDWKPSLTAQSLSRSRSFALGLVLARPPELLAADPFFPGFIAGIESVLADVGQSLVLTVVPAASEEQTVYRRLQADQRVDGVFVTDLRAGDERVATLSELGLPAVTLGRPDVTSPFPAVTQDDGQGIADIVRVLLDRGHQRIAHVSGPAEFLHAAHRAAAWSATMRAAGVADAPVVAADFTPAGGAAATERLLDSDRPPTAIVYANDVMAIAGAAVAAQRGIDVPGRLSIAGFDDIEIARYLHPPLTTVRTDPFGWGREATRVLLHLIEHGAADSVDLPAASMVLRDSVARVHRPRRRTTTTAR